jgi:deoxycytidylate deaminase
MVLAETNKYDEVVDYHLSAIIVRGGSIVSVGYNKANTNSFVEHYADRVKGKRNFCLSTHAEMDAVLRIRNKIDLSGCKIFVARRKLIDGSPGMARPCAICEEVLRSYGIKRAFYTIDDNHYGIMSISETQARDKIERY